MGNRAFCTRQSTKFSESELREKSFLKILHNKTLIRITSFDTLYPAYIRQGDSAKLSVLANIERSAGRLLRITQRV